MEEKENVHSGHRERMLHKFMGNPDALLDHELLEVLLFFALPRKDTNPLAHKIIDQFGSIEKVFSATAEELKTVDGVGDKVAGLIVLFGKMSKIIVGRKKNNRRLSSFSDVKEELCEYFLADKEEKFVLLLLDSKHYLITRLEVSNADRNQVATDIKALSKSFALHKPTFVVLAHNHPSGDFNPSLEDDLATKRIKLLCDLHGVVLLDHVVCSGENFFSYHLEGKMDVIKSDADLNKLLINVKENEYGYK